MTSDDYDQHSLLGEWHLSAVQLATNAVGFYRAYHIKYGHKTPQELEYRIAGVLRSERACMRSQRLFAI